jgi:hypothetical protein
MRQGKLIDRSLAFRELKSYNSCSFFPAVGTGGFPDPVSKRVGDVVVDNVGALGEDRNK